MSVQVFILIQTEVGKASSVAAAVGAIAGVTLAEGVTGPYDVIMRAESLSMEDLGVKIPLMSFARVFNIESLVEVLFTNQK